MHAIEERVALIDEILTPWQSRVGTDYAGYRNHVYRMVNFCFALQDCSDAERHKIVIAGCFHDLGIWASGTFDYLPPSILLAREYLDGHHLQEWSQEIELMIDLHHKLKPIRASPYVLPEVFRKGDLVDFSLGLVKYGLPVDYVRRVRRLFSNAGFHRRLLLLEVGWLARHPTRPIPVLKW